MASELLTLIKSSPQSFQHALVPVLPVSSTHVGRINIKVFNREIETDETGIHFPQSAGHAHMFRFLNLAKIHLQDIQALLADPDHNIPQHRTFSTFGTFGSHQAGIPHGFPHGVPAILQPSRPVVPVGRILQVKVGLLVT